MGLPHNALTVAAIQGIFLGLAWLFVIIRLYIRKFMIHGVALDDYALFLTLLLYTVEAATISVIAGIYEFNYAPSHPGYHISLPQISKGIHYFYLAEIFYTLTCAALRVTVGLLLLRIASTKPQKITIYITTAIMIVFSTIFLFLAIFQCTPAGYYWDLISTTGTCWIEHHVLAKAAYTYAAISFLSDWTLGLMPIWLLWHVQISRSKKFGVGAMLGMGMICGVAAITRCAYIGKVSVLTFETNWIGLGICSIVEPGVGIIAASIAAFKPVFATQWFQKLSSKANFSRQGLLGRSGRSVSGRVKSEKKNVGTVHTSVKGATRERTSEVNEGSEFDVEHGIRVTYALDRRESLATGKLGV